MWNNAANVNVTKIMKKILYALITIIIIAGAAQAQDAAIKWMSFAEAEKQMRLEPKKVFIDVYTTWCGWCKKLDATTSRSKL